MQHKTFDYYLKFKMVTTMFYEYKWKVHMCTLNTDISECNALLAANRGNVLAFICCITFVFLLNLFSIYGLDLQFAVCVIGTTPGA